MRYLNAPADAAVKIERGEGHIIASDVTIMFRHPPAAAADSWQRVLAFFAENIRGRPPTPS